MVAMKNMRRTAEDRDAEMKAGGEVSSAGAQKPRPEADDVEVRLEHHHLAKLGLDPMPNGTKIEFGGHGEIADTGTREDYDGEPRNHMTLRLRRAGMEPKESADTRREDVRGDVERAVEAAGRDGAKIMEKAGGKG